MKRKTIIFTITAFFGLNACASNNGLVSVNSQYSVEQTHQRLLDILTKKGMTVFDTIDHSDNATKVDIEIPSTRTVIFGNPKIGSKLMQCAPSIAIDLPQKMLIQEGAQGKVTVTYNAPAYMQSRHQMKGCEALTKKVTKALSAFANYASGAATN